MLSTTSRVNVLTRIKRRESFAAITPMDTWRRGGFRQWGQRKQNDLPSSRLFALAEWKAAPALRQCQNRLAPWSISPWLRKIKSSYKQGDVTPSPGTCTRLMDSGKLTAGKYTWTNPEFKVKISCHKKLAKTCGISFIFTIFYLRGIHIISLHIQSLTLRW